MSNFLPSGCLLGVTDDVDTLAAIDPAAAIYVVFFCLTVEAAFVFFTNLYKLHWSGDLLLDLFGNRGFRLLTVQLPSREVESGKNWN